MIAQLFATALQYHQAGNLGQAERLYRQILQSDPHHADTHHLLGVLAYQVGRFDQAVPSIRQAIALQPWAPVYHSNLGLAYEAVGRMDDALASYREALRLQPDFADAHNALGNALGSLGRQSDSEMHCRLALRSRPDFPDALNNLGNALLRQGKPAEAETHYRQALRLRPNYPEAHCNLGLALMDQGKRDEAVAHYREALRLNPSYAAAYNNLGNALRDQWKLDEAVDCYQQALRLQPNYAEAHNNLGIAVKGRGKLAEAVRCYQEALRLKPSYPEAHNNLANALKDQGQLDEALLHYDEALRLKPDYGEPRWNRSLLWLLRGDFARGWPDYEWRWTQPGFAPRPFAQPRWDGSPLQGRTILLHAEQGLGDTLQFIRYVPLVKARGGTVIVECPAALVEVLAGFPGIDRLVARDAPLPPFDLQAPLLSVAGIFRTTLETIPASVPYLHADAARVDRWRRELGPIKGLKIGIVWQGNPAHRNDRQRSVPLTRFTSLGRMEGVQLCSLQVGPGTEQLATLGDSLNVMDLGSRFDPGSLADAAAVLKVLDLVVTVDTAIAHLAGALAVPVWVALPFIPDWRWLLEREDSPWYPTMRLFRQRRLDDWDEVFERITTAVRRRATNDRETGSDPTGA